MSSWILCSQLFLAIQNQDVKQAKAILLSGVDMDVRFQIRSEKRLALGLCVENNDLEMVKMMIEQGASVNQSDPSGSTPLHIAAENGYSEMVALLLKAKAEVNARSGAGSTPLHYAARRGHSDIVEYLHNAGGHINSADDGGKTPLHMAACSADRDIVERLVNIGACPYVSDKEGNSPLHYAVQGCASLTSIHLLITFCRDRVLRRNHMGLHPVEILLKSRRRDCYDILKLILLEDFAGVQQPGTPQLVCGINALNLAVEENKVDCVRLLLSAGFDANGEDMTGRTPLPLAIRRRNITIVQLLLAAGAKVSRSVEQCLETRVSPELEPIQQVVYKALRTPPSLTNCCRAVLTARYGLQCKKLLAHFPLSWRQFLAYESLEL